MAATETMTHQDALAAQYLSSSFSTLSRSRSTNSLIVRAYKQATQLYLTKRFKEAWDVLAPIINAEQASDEHSSATDTDDTAQTNGAGGAAPIAQTSTGTRTKVWVFYLSLINAIIELGPEEGKLQFGSSQWRLLAAKARDGSAWEDIVQRGYGGREGEVDADVVVNLATLLLSHMPRQRLNQQRLEAWLSASSASADAPGSHVQFADGTMSPLPNGMTTPGTSPKALATRLKILELYALHVLPANEEWVYAKEFIEMSDSLDEERKEEFLQALQQLRDERDGTARRERELAEQRERKMAEQQRAEEAHRVEEAQKPADEQRKKAAEAEQRKALNGHTAPPKPTRGLSKPSALNGQTAKPAAPQPTSRPSSSKAQKKPPSSPPVPSSPNIYRRASLAVLDFQRTVMQASRQMTGGNPMALLRFVMFVLAFVLVMARRDLRIKVRRMIENGWVKVRKTVGMGIKVSYI